MGEVIYRVKASEVRRAVPDQVAVLRAAIEELGSQAAVARALGVSRSAIAQWLSGNLIMSEERLGQVMALLERVAP